MPVRIKIDESYKEGPNSIGGAPVMLRGRYPRCAHCDQKMVLLFQFDTTKEMGLPYPVGSHFSLLQCPEHTIPLAPEQGFIGPRSRKACTLPEVFWNDRPFWHIRAQLVKKGTDQKVHNEEARLKPKSLSFEVFEEKTENFKETDLIKGETAFKIGGETPWNKGARKFTCTCGSKMVFLAHLPSKHVFEGADGGDVMFCEGKATHFIACQALCYPQAIWAVHDDD